MPYDLATWVAAAYAEVTVSQQPAAPEDTAAITSKVTGLVADLSQRRVYTLVDTASIPNAVFPDLTHLLAEHSAPLFGKEIDLAKIKALEGRLREIDRHARTTGYTYLIQEVFNLLEVWGQDANAIDLVAVQNQATLAAADLLAKRVISIPDVDNPPNGVTNDFARYIAASLANPPLVAIKEEAEKRLRELDRATYRSGDNLLTKRVLDLLEVYGQGRSVMDAATVEDHADDILQELASRGVVTITDIDDVDAEYLPNLARYIAAALSSPPLYPVMDKAARELRTQTRTRVDDEPIRAVYY